MGKEEEEEVKRINELQQATHQDIYWNPGYGAFLYDSQQPSHKNDLLCQMQQGCNLHTHNPGRRVEFELMTADYITINSLTI